MQEYEKLCQYGGYIVERMMLPMNSDEEFRVREAESGRVRLLTNSD